jgi:hypothetical protein
MAEHGLDLVDISMGMNSDTGGNLVPGRLWPACPIR